VRTGRHRVTVNGHDPAFGAEVFRTLVSSTGPVSLQIGASANGKFNYSPQTPKGLRINFSRFDQRGATYGEECQFPVSDYTCADHSFTIRRAGGRG
jgi:hypothetical protein